MTTPARKVLAETELLRVLDSPALDQILPALDQVRVPGGQLVFCQGDMGDCLYLLAYGRLRVSVERADGSEEIVGEVGRGESVGEMALLTGEKRTATVRAVRDSELYRLSADAFNRLLERHPKVTMQLARRIVMRYVGAVGATRPATGPATIALLPASPQTPLSAASHGLEDALAELGPTLRLNSDVVDAALWPEASQVPPDHARTEEVLGWLNDQESQHRFVIYEADLIPSAWSRRCVRQADRILVIADADQAAVAGPTEQGMRAEGPHVPAVRRELVLLHREPRAVYSGTSEWLAKLRVTAHHHVVVDSAADFSRLARFLAGRATGLVLGGGGTRCFAHIGVIRALWEAGIAIDVIGGTSMGAFIAAQYALGWDHARMRAYNRDTWLRVRPMQDYTLPVLSLLTGAGFRKVARDIAGEAEIEDLATRFFCVSSNLTRARSMVHQQGPLWRGMVASISVPGLTPPVVEGGDLLVDGAVLDNVPIDVMRHVCDGTVIASDVSPLVDLAVDAEAGVSPGLWRRIAPWGGGPADGRKAPTIVDVLSRVSSLNSTVAIEAMKRHANLYLHPPTEEFTVVDWKRAEALIDVGYEYAVQAVGEWIARGKGAGESSARRISMIVPPARKKAPRR